MLKEIQNKIIDIESKLSSDVQDIVVETLDTSLRSPSIKRYSSISSDFSTPFGEMMREINDSILYMNDVSLLINQFYNTKETQMQAFRDRYEVLALRKKVLNSFLNEDNISVLSLNDKNMFIPDSKYGMDESGIWFPALETVSFIPTKVTILSDSNIKIGAQSNPFQNSKIEALWNNNQNDLFSFFRDDESALKLCLNVIFSKNEIINEMEFEYIKNMGQDVNLFVRNTQNQDILFNGLVKDYWVQLAKPALTDSLYIEIKVSPKQINQFDVKKISFLKVKYKNELKARTIRMPIFSNKYLFFKDYTLLDNRQKSFLDFKILANTEKLEAKDVKLSGPIKDPEFYIECSISNVKLALDYLEKTKFEKSKRLPSEYLFKNAEYKVVEELLSENKQTIIHIVENSNRVFLTLPFANLEDYFKVTVNGEKQTRISAKTDLAEGYYFSEYTGEGYTFYFNSLNVGTPVDLHLSTIPTYVYGEQISIPHNGLGSSIGLEYAKELNIASMSPTYSGNQIILGKKYIQKIIFKWIDGSEVSWRLVDRKETYEAYEYSLDRVEGIIYLNQSLSAIGSLDVYYLETEQVSGKTDTENKTINCPDNILTFNYMGALEGLLSSNFRIFSLMDRVLDFPKMSIDLRTIQLPKSISLHYGSVRISNKKEVPYINGQQELSTLSDSTEYFDYKSKVDGIVTYQARNTSLNLADFFAKSLSIEDFAFDRRVANGTPVNEGDYYFDGNELYLKLSQNHSLTVGVKATTSESLNVFSVDYSANRIFVKLFNSLNWFETGESATVGQTPISFDYSCIKVIDFTLEKEIPKKEFLNTNEYFLFASNIKDIGSLLPYYSPVIESVALGVIG